MFSKTFIWISCFLCQIICFSQSRESRVRDLTKGMYEEMKLTKDQKDILFVINSDFITKRDSILMENDGMEPVNPEVEAKIQELGKGWKKSIKKVAGGSNFRRWFKSQNINKEKLPYIDIWLSPEE